MKNPKNRDLFKQLYRLAEEYEEIPHLMTGEEIGAYFNKLHDEIQKLYKEHPCALTSRMGIALIDALEDQYKEVYLHQVEPWKYRYPETAPVKPFAEWTEEEKSESETLKALEEMEKQSEAVNA